MHRRFGFFHTVHTKEDEGMESGDASPHSKIVRRERPLSVATMLGNRVTDDSMQLNQTIAYAQVPIRVAAILHSVAIIRRKMRHAIRPKDSKPASSAGNMVPVCVVLRNTSAAARVNLFACVHSSTMRIVPVVWSRVMGKSPDRSVPTSPAEGATTQHRYRCVCGVSFDFEPAAGRTCPQCGRHYGSQVLNEKFADTTTFAGEFAIRTTPEQPQSDSLIGTTRGHFRIVSRLGEGGMGCVYQAIDESLQRYVALKVIRQQGTANHALFDQLVQEARAQARVNHPNVAHIYFVGQADDSPFFAMELIPGRTLSQRLEGGPLPFGEVVRIGLQVASALDRAAQYDIVHGDIKPSNILEADSQTVKISDFGLSRRLSASSNFKDQIVGTPNYLSPETARGEKTDTRSDIYSLGVTLFELTFGKLPYEFSGVSIAERLDAHLTQTPSFPVPWPVTVPESWRDILQRMLEKDPADRYQNYGELMADLARVLPKRLIPAPRLSRLIAWLFDSATLTILQGIVIGPPIVLNAIGEVGILWRSFASIIGTLLAGVLLLGVMWVQCRWGATPGKMFFQLAVVDAHGLRPSRRILSLRLLFQFPWIAFFLSPMLDIMGLGFIDSLFGVAMLLLVLTNAGYVLFRRDQRALHDWILRTQVVVHAEEG